MQPGRSPRVQAESAPLDEVLPFRRAHLRPPGHPIEPPKPADLLPAARHFVVRDAGEIVACASVHPMQPPGADDAGAWQLRAVASAPRVRRQGAGRAVVEACVAHARASGASQVWCHARTSARGFYERLGFVALGEPYEIPVSGPHVLMRRLLP